MSFQAYLDTIEKRTGLSPTDLRRLAAEKGVTENGMLRSGVKAGAVTDWLKADLDLRHGHATAVYAPLKGLKTEGDL